METRRATNPARKQPDSRAPARASSVKIVGRAAAALSATAAKLSADQQRLVVRYQARLPDVMAKVLAQLDAPATAKRMELTPQGPVEVSQGAGISDLLSAEEGAKRLQAYALATGGDCKAWAGPTAGPVEIERQLGVPRSTLHLWQAKGLVVRLIDGVRKPVFPLEQFVESKPVAGIADVLEVIGEPNTTWMWLKEPHPLLDGAPPLARLKRGALAEVMNAVRANFDQ